MNYNMRWCKANYLLPTIGQIIQWSGYKFKIIEVSNIKYKTIEFPGPIATLIEADLVVESLEEIEEIYHNLLLKTICMEDQYELQINTAKCQMSK